MAKDGDVIRQWVLALAMGSAFSGAVALPARAAEIVPFQDLDADRCFNFLPLAQQQAGGKQGVGATAPWTLVVNDAQSYDRLFDPSLLRQSCAGLDSSKTIPSVDFATQTVLGYWRVGLCADAGFERRVTRDAAEHRFIYSVTRVPSPKRACMGPGPASLNLVAIDKVPDGYRVEFLVGQ
jgi:hypothetical protein